MFRGGRKHVRTSPAVVETVTSDELALPPAPSEPANLPSSGARVVLPALQTFGTVGATLGQGGQGAVFRLDVDGSDRPRALKWYFPRAATARQEAVLEDLVSRGAPTERFLWPASLARPTEQSALGGFGYVMDLRTEGYVGLVDFVTGRADVSFRELATLGLELADCFLALHNEGLCYRDISFGNVFFEPGTGHVLICDNDNVVIDGVGPSTVKGTPYFMAPEVVRGDALPSRNTDLWSLAVLLFYLFMVHHPLEGKRALEYDCWDEVAMRDLFGENPVFVFDPRDDSNRPEPGVHDNVLIYWALYPHFLRDRFEEAFTSGIADPDNGRVRESVWRSTMAQLRDAIAYCHRCGRQNFYDDAREGATCWSCRSVIRMPPRVRFGRRVVVLNHDTQLYAHHLHRDYDFDEPIAKVVRHPRDETVWGLQNVGPQPWRATPAGGEVQTVEPGRSATILEGLEIDFGPARAVIEE